MSRQPNPQPVQVDWRYHQHRKITQLSIAGEAVHLRMLCLANGNLTDGHLTHEEAMGIAQAVLDKGTSLVPSSPTEQAELVASLVRVRLLHENGAGYVIHDYREYQIARETVEQRARWRRQK